MAFENIHPAILLLQFKAKVYYFPYKTSLILNRLFSSSVYWSLAAFASTMLAGCVLTPDRCASSPEDNISNSTLSLGKFIETDFVIFIGGFGICVIGSSTFILSCCEIFLKSFCLRLLETKNTQALICDDVDYFKDNQIEIPGMMPCSQRTYSLPRLAYAIGAIKINSLYPLYNEKIFLYDFYKTMDKNFKITDITPLILSYLRFKDIKIKRKDRKHIDENDMKYFYPEDMEYQKLKDMGLGELYKRYLKNQSYKTTSSHVDIENQLDSAQISNLTPLLRA